MPSRLSLLIGALLLWGMALANGPYSLALNDPESAFDAPIPGFVGPDGDGKMLTQGPSNYVNPLFFDWAETVVEYSPFGTVSAAFTDPSLTLGPVTGDHFDVAALGDMTQTEINAWLADPVNEPGPGTITVTFNAPISDKTGADFVIFENGFLSGSSSSGGIFAELAYVEVSANGVDFVRFPTDSNTASSVGSFGAVNAGDIYNLAGKHVNGYGDSWGTPFDLAEVGLTSITHVRLVDIPGSGDFLDTSNASIYDSWFTFGSGGVDLEAVGVISRNLTYEEWPQLEALAVADRDPEDDPDVDGLSNLAEYAFATLPWSPDAENARVQITIDETGAPVVRLIRDERLQDVDYILEVTDDPTDSGSWQPLASSSAGGPFAAVLPYAPEITEASSSAIASIGVLREVLVRDPGVAGPQYYRVRIEQVGL